MKTAAIITGASQGIGAELVGQLIGEFDVLILIARNHEKLLALKQAFPNQRMEVIPGDLQTDRVYLELESLLKQGFALRSVVHNAGYLVNAPVAELSLESFRAMYEVNVTAYFRLVKTIMPHLSDADACHFVVSGSMGGVGGSAKFPGLTGYSSSKGAALILNEVFAAEYAETKHRFNTLSLGSAQTEMLEAAFPGYKAPVSAKTMAEFMAWFVLNGGRYMNGKNIPVALTTP